jgi:hypothetical protein
MGAKGPPPLAPFSRELPTIAFHAASQGQQRSPMAHFTAPITASGSGLASATGGNALLTKSAANTGQHLLAHHCRKSINNSFFVLRVRVKKTGPKNHPAHCCSCCCCFSGKNHSL